ncbi:MAG: class I SAM-dependent methyltransferase [Hyphomicrobiales bacterium]|nr:class I SAM-dependent methyltransferase [Hyphomicrobiales bacterium]
MQIEPTVDDWRLARSIHKDFCKKAGSKHIATPFALAHLSALVREHPIQSVLEFGPGIGTITSLLLKTLPNEINIVCTEKSGFCRREIQKNIPSTEKNRIFIHDHRDPEIHGQFDLVVFDGPPPSGADFLNLGSICFFEGNRKNTRQRVVAALEARGLTCNFQRYVSYIRPIRWTWTRFNIPRPYIRLRSQKGCWIGRVTTTANGCES